MKITRISQNKLKIEYFLFGLKTNEKIVFYNPNECYRNHPQFYACYNDDGTTIRGDNYIVEKIHGFLKIETMNK